MHRSKYTDLMAAASILKNRKVSSNVRLSSPASLRDQQRAEREGIMRILEDAGAEFLPNSPEYAPVMAAIDY